MWDKLSELGLDAEVADLAQHVLEEDNVNA